MRKYKFYTVSELKNMCIARRIKLSRNIHKHKIIQLLIQNDDLRKSIDDNESCTIDDYQKIPPDQEQDINLKNQRIKARRMSLELENNRREEEAAERLEKNAAYFIEFDNDILDLNSKGCN